MHDAVIVSTARTPITKAQRGAFNVTPGPTLAAYAVRAAVDRAGIDPGLVEDVILGCGHPDGTTGRNVARQAAVRAGLPVSVAGTTVNRFCASGLQAIAIAASRIAVERVPAVIAGGVESCSFIGQHQTPATVASEKDPWIVTHKPDLYLSMLETGDIVAQRYGISREAQDRFAVESQRRTSDAQRQGLFVDEIIACTTEMSVADRETGGLSRQEVTVDHDTCNRPGTTYEALAKLQPVRGPDQFVTAGNASQLSDGASACVLMDAQDASRRGIEPLGIFRGFAVAGCEPDEMGVGPVHAVPRLLSRCGIKADDVDLWELNEAFASQALYCIDRLHLPRERLNVNGGAISLGHPYGMTGSRMVGHLLLEGRRRHARYVVATMCVAGGMGAAGLFEVA